MALIAAQFYTLREYCKTERGFVDACRRVKTMGYDGIQLSGVIELDGRETKRILDGEGLQAAATHVSLDAMENHTDEVIERHLEMGCLNAAIGGFFPKNEDWSKELWEGFIQRYNQVARKFAGTGIRLGYHNHSHEFVKAGNRRPMDMLLYGLDPMMTWMEIDTYWVAHGGADPAEYIRRAAGRIPCVHVKDMTMTLEHAPLMTEIGDGNLNWPRIIEACRYAGVTWYIVERDDGVLNPFDSLERSIRTMRRDMGL